MSTQNKKNRYLVFKINDEEFGVPLLTIQQVIDFREATEIPFAPSYFKGIINLRGQIISIIDLRKKLRIATAANTEETTVIILNVLDFCLGIIVDSVEAVLSVDEEELNPSPEVDGSISSDYIAAVAKRGDGLVFLLDVEKTLSVSDIQIARKAAA